MSQYVITTPRPGFAPYSLAGSMLIGGPPPIGTYSSSENLVGWWRLNENVSSTGNVSDSSGNQRTGTFPLFNNRPGYSALTPGIIQTHTNTFDGSQKVVDIGTAALWNSIIGTTGSGKLSISMWINPAASPTAHYLLRFGGGDLEVYSDASHRITFRRDFVPSPGIWRTIGGVPADTWTNVIITYDSSSTSNSPNIFINGSNVATHTIAIPEGDLKEIDGDPGYLGGVNFGGSPLNWFGLLADVAIWDTVLSQSDVAAIYNAIVGPTYYTYRNYDLIGYGQRLSPTGSQEQLSLQGLNAQSDDIYFPSLLPRIRQGAPMAMWRRGEKISQKYFDDSISLPFPGSRQSMRGENDEKISLRVNFEWEQLNFGQAPEVQQGEAYVETNRFNAVDYLRSSEETMWPVNLFNIGSLLDHEFDGVIEPFDIRGELLGIVRSRFEGHAVRGSLTGGTSETYFGSKQIVDKWKSSDEKMAFFLDAPINWESIPVGAYSNITNEPDTPWEDEPAFDITTAPMVVNNPAFLQPQRTSYTISSLVPEKRWTNGPAGYRNLPVASELLAWWRMNTNVSESGDVIDSSGNNRNGIFDSLANRPELASDSSFPPYVQTRTLKFNGLGDLACIDIHHYDWNTLIGGSGASAKPFSISCWARLDGTDGSANGILCSFGNSIPRRTLYYAESTNTLHFGIKNVGGPGSTLCSAINNLNVGHWAHIVATFAGHAGGGTMKLYIDGVVMSTATQPDADSIDSNGSIGNLEGFESNNAWNGLMADFALWSKELTLQEVEALRDASNGVYQDELKEDPLIAALRSMDGKGDRCEAIDPAEKRANHGFYFGQNAGSITYGDEGDGSR